MKNYKIAVAGTGYVGLSLSVLLAQHNQVMAVDIVRAKVDMINNHRFAKSIEVKKPMNYVEKGVSKSIAKIIESFNDRTDMIVI